MVKASVLIAFAICTAVSGAFLWVKSESLAKAPLASAATMPSLQELHAKAHAYGLPDRTVKEAY
jgi:hypothetical protein